MYFTKAKMYYESEQYQKSLDQLNTILEVNPSDTESLDLLAKVHRKREHYLKALRIYYFLVKRDFPLGRELLKESDIEAVGLKVLNSVENDDLPTRRNLRHLLNIGITYFEYYQKENLPTKEFKNNLIELSHKYFEICRDFSYELSTVHYYEGLIAQVKGEKVKTTDRFQNALDLAQLDGTKGTQREKNLKLMLGDSFASRGHPEIAQYYYRELKYDEKSNDSLRFLATNYLKSIEKSYLGFDVFYDIQSIDNVHSLNRVETDNFRTDSTLQKRYKITDSNAAKYGFGVMYMTDQTDDIALRFALNYDELKYSEHLLTEFDRRTIEAAVNSNVKFTEWTSFRIGGGYKLISGSVYEAGFYKKNQRELALHGGLQHIYGWGKLGFFIPYVQKQYTQQFNVNESKMQYQLLAHLFGDNEYFSPAFHIGFGTYNGGGVFSDGSLYSYSISNTIHLTDWIRFVPTFDYLRRNSSRQIENRSTLNWGLVSHVSLQNLVRGFSLKFQFHQNRVKTGETRNLSSNKTTLSAGINFIF